MGYTVVDPANVVATHLTEVARRYCHELFTHQDAAAYIDRVKEESPKLVEDLVPKLTSLTLVHRLLQNLLKERVPVRDATTILEAVAEGAGVTKNVTLLTEFVRQSMARTLVRPYLNDRRQLPAYLLDGSIEQIIQPAIEDNDQSSRLTLAPQQIQEVFQKIQAVVGSLQGPTVLLCSATARFGVRQIVEAELPLLAVLSHAEIPPQVEVVSLGVAG